MEDKTKKKIKTTVAVTGALVIGSKVYGTLKRKNATKNSKDLNSWWKN